MASTKPLDTPVAISFAAALRTRQGFIPEILDEPLRIADGETGPRVGFIPFVRAPCLDEPMRDHKFKFGFKNFGYKT